MSDTTIILRKRLRAVLAGGLAVLLVAALGTGSRSVPMVPTAFRRTSAVGQRRMRFPAARTQQQQQQVEAIADTSGWNWRAAGVRYVVGFHPQACCHWGIYDSRNATIYIGPTAFATAERLRYVVLHETAHAWQYRAGPTQALVGDYARWGFTGANALEAGGDCIATLWGATLGHYWRCPAEARVVAARELGRA